MEKVVIGADHRGYELKEALKKMLSKRLEFIDVGTHSSDMDDFPSIAEKAVKRMRHENAPGILICGSGFGMAMAANKMKGIRAASCREELDAHYARQHNDANVLCLGANFIKEDKAKKIVETFLSTPFSHEERYSRRITQIKEMEEKRE